MACCTECQGSQRAHRTQVRALRWGVVAADPGPGTDPFYRAAAVENVVSQSVPAGNSSWPRRDIHMGLSAFYGGDSVENAGANAPRSTTPSTTPSLPHEYTYAHEEEDDPPVFLDEGDGEDTDDDEEAACCCRVVSAQILITNVSAGEDSPGVAYSLLRITVKMSYKPKAEGATPDDCKAEYQERTTKTFYAPPRLADGTVTADPPSEEVEVPAGTPKPGSKEPTLTPKWIDVWSYVRGTHGHLQGVSGAKQKSWDEVLPEVGCPDEVIWRTTDRPSAPKGEWPRKLQIKLTIHNGDACAGTTVRKVIQNIDANGKVTTEPPAFTPARGAQKDPKGWSEPPKTKNGPKKK